ncbi:calcitonin gene-related peptide type 1 receptor-like isoform X2 [Periplaneta americana]
MRIVTCIKNGDMNFLFPCILLPDNVTTLEFDFNNNETLRYLDSVFVGPEVTQRWVDCSKSAISCCESKAPESMQPVDGYCPTTWDGWTCFDKTPIETTQSQPCPYYVYSGTQPSCQQYNYKDCLDTGRWNFSTFSYAPCSGEPINMMRNRTSYHVILLAVSIGLSLPAVVIFFSYKKLRVTRVVLHRNLILCIVIRNAFSIAVKTAVYLESLGETYAVMEENSVWCRTLSFLDKLCGSAVYSCMLLEGIFLHRLIAAAFKGEPNMLYYYIGTAAWAVLPVFAWTIVTAIDNDMNCWAVDSTGYSYIFDGPRMLTLAINALLMLDIVRVLFTKLKKINTAKSGHVRRMTRATILLMPLFGVPFLLTLERPSAEDCTLEQVYYYFFYTMDGLQGALVTLLYCYLNKEVQVQLLHSYHNLMTRVYRLMGKDYVPKHRPTWTYSERKQTTTSVVMSDGTSRPSMSFFPSTLTDTPHSPTSVSFAPSPLVIGDNIVTDAAPPPERPSILTTFKSNSSPHAEQPSLQDTRQRRTSSVNIEDPIYDQIEIYNLQSKARDSDEESMKRSESQCHWTEGHIGINLTSSASPEQTTGRIRRRTLSDDETYA